MIREDHAVQDEVVVIRLIAKVATVCIELFSAPYVSCLETMIAPFPHPSTLQSRVLVECVDVLLNISRPVPHGVNILTEYKRLCEVRLLCKFNDLFYGQIHAREEVRCFRLKVLLIMYGSGCIDCSDGIVH